MIEKFIKYLLDIDRYQARKYLLEIKDEVDVVEAIIVPALTQIGDGWKNGDNSLSQVYMSSVICEDLADELFSSSGFNVNQSLNIAIVTFDDYHTFGKKLVSLTLKASGYKILDFGLIFAEDKLLKMVKDNKIDVLMMSVLMLPPAFKIIELKPKLLEINPNIQIIVGGAPFRFDKELYKKIGADAAGDTPADALRIIQELEGRL